VRYGTRVNDASAQHRDQYHKDGEEEAFHAGLRSVLSSQMIQICFGGHEARAECALLSADGKADAPPPTPAQLCGALVALTVKNWQSVRGRSTLHMRPLN
jgi:hypothetical protein